MTIAEVTPHVKRDAFFSTDTAERLAELFRTTPQGLRMFWLREKAAGRLPKIEREVERPTKGTALAARGSRSTSIAALDALADETGVNDAIDGRPTTGGNNADPLLAALQREHGVDPARAFDDVEGDRLDLEIGLKYVRGDDGVARKVKVPPQRPSADKMKMLANCHDVSMTAILKAKGRKNGRQRQ